MDSSYIAITHYYHDDPIPVFADDMLCNLWNSFSKYGSGDASKICFVYPLLIKVMVNAFCPQPSKIGILLACMLQS